MNYSALANFRLAWAVLGLGLALVLSACLPSALILSAARNEYGLINKQSTRATVERHLGPAVLDEAVAPVALAQLEFPPAVEERDRYRERNFLHGWEGNAGLAPSIP